LTIQEALYKSAHHHHHYQCQSADDKTIEKDKLLNAEEKVCGRGVDPYGTGGHVPQYL